MCINLPMDVDRLLEEEAREKMISKSDVIRIIISEWYSRSKRSKSVSASG